MLEGERKQVTVLFAGLKGCTGVFGMLCLAAFLSERATAAPGDRFTDPSLLKHNSLRGISGGISQH
jgi:hypothetical protein